MEGKATFVRELHHVQDKFGVVRIQRLYALDPPLHQKCSSCGHSHEVRHVVVSCVTAPRPETFIFAADDAGVITDWLELRGSIVGAINFEGALRGAGYEVTP